VFERTASKRTDNSEKKKKGKKIRDVGRVKHLYWGKNNSQHGSGGGRTTKKSPAECVNRGPARLTMPAEEGERKKASSKRRGDRIRNGTGK